MIRKFLYLATALLYLFTISCTTAKDVPPNKVRDQTDHIIAIVLKTGDVIRFNDYGGRYDALSQTIAGQRLDNSSYSTPISEVISASVERTNAAAIIIPIVIVGLFIALIAASQDSGGSSTSSSGTSGSSCPYVYSYDGANYVLDAEPLSGAITKGLEREDRCRLDHVRPVDGRYELLVRNELQETQYIDQVKLAIVEHPKDTQVYADINGALHTVANPVPLTDAHDDTGMDMRQVLAEADHVAWLSSMPTDDAWRTVSLRQDIEFSFAKPRDARTANLIVNAATSEWGSIMMREMMQARGEKLAQWRRSVDENGPAMAEMVAFNLREELYFLKVYVRENDAWVQRGLIPGGGPMVSETRVVALDLSGATGDTVQLRVSPPRGYWSFDYLAMSYDERPAPLVSEIPLAHAQLSGGDDATASLAVADGAYHEMHHVGDAMTLTFDAPAQTAANERAIFLETRGYYHSHIDESQPEQTELIREMLGHDGAIVRYSLQKFVEFVNQQARR